MPRELARLPEVRAGPRGRAWRWRPPRWCCCRRCWVPARRSRRRPWWRSRLVILSITVLTGWAGQVSLGQMGFVAIGAAPSAPTSCRRWGWDLALTLPVVGLAGRRWWRSSSACPPCGCRACTWRSITLAFALATTRYLLNPQFFPWVPAEPRRRRARARRVARRRARPTRTTWRSAAFAVVVVRRPRHPPQPHRPGAGRAARERAGGGGLRRVGRAGQAHRVRPVRVRRRRRRRAAGRAAAAGSRSGLFPEADNLVVFTAAVVGGLGSVTGSVDRRPVPEGRRLVPAGRLAPVRLVDRRAARAAAACPAGWAVRCSGPATSACAGWPAGATSSCRAWWPTSASSRTRPRRRSRQRAAAMARTPTAPDDAVGRR